MKKGGKAMKLFIAKYEGNEIYGISRIFDVIIVTFSYASTKGKGRRRTVTKVLITDSESEQKKEHFRRWASQLGYSKALLFSWDNVGIAWLEPRDFITTKRMGSRLIKQCPYLKHALKTFQPNQWFTDIAASISKVEYRYNTVRGTEKTYYKDVYHFGDENPDSIFSTWVKDFNHNYPYRELRNVQILCSSNLNENVI